MCEKHNAKRSENGAFDLSLLQLPGRRNCISLHCMAWVTLKQCSSVHKSEQFSTSSEVMDFYVCSLLFTMKNLTVLCLRFYFSWVTIWQTKIKNKSIEYQEVELKWKDALVFVLRLIPTFRASFLTYASDS